MLADNATTLLLSFFALSIIGVGFVRARPYGKLGLLAWLQSVVLMAPWLLFFGLFAFGIYLSFAIVLFLFVLATITYVLIGRQLRVMGQDQMVRDRLEKLMQAPPATAPGEDAAGDASPGAGSPEAGSPEGTNPGPPNRSNPLPPGLPAPLPPIPAEDVSLIREIFGIDTFFATETIPYQQGAIFKGNLRGVPDVVQPKLAERLKARVADRYRLFLINGPEDRPVVVVLPNSADPPPVTMGQWVLAAGLLLATLFTLLERGALQAGFDLVLEPQRIGETLPIGLGLLATLIAHEAGHWVFAHRYGVKLSPPFLIPAWQLGSYGAITRIEAFLPNRTALFDIAFAGPAIGFLLSLVFLVLGLFLSVGGGGVELPTVVLEGSMLVGALARIILGNDLQTELLKVHPLVIVGWLGLVIHALNLMPAGQLDGGRMMQAIYGRKVASRTSVVTLIFLAIASLFNPVALYWAVLILFVQRQPERPAQDELTEPDDARAALCLLGLLIVLAVLLPLTPSLAGRLGIGLENSLLPL